jgi:hypothetical protein
MSKSLVSLSLFVFSFGITASCLHASGGYGPFYWLGDGGIASNHSPEFYWAIEVKRIALDFIPAEKRVGYDEKAAQSSPEPELPIKTWAAQTEEANETEFAQALQSGRIRSADPKGSITLNNEARLYMADKEPKVTLEDHEFTDYQRGAYHFSRGRDGYADAKAAWEHLLARPKEQRHYRSTWAAFMLGKLAIYEKQGDGAKWFQMTRSLAREGFADSIGLAADSYGWEAKWELDRQNYEAAARLYLTQLALGDDSAIASLKHVFPFPVQGQPETETFSRMAKDEVLRRLKTASILCGNTTSDMYGYATIRENSAGGFTAWLKTLQEAGVQQDPDADRIAWCAYSAGEYAAAKNWLQLASPNKAMTLWLKAKLLRRDGENKAATLAMAKAAKAIVQEFDLIAPWTKGYGGEYSQAMPFCFGGDFAGLHLSRGDFMEAFEAFREFGLFHDCHFMAERVFTLRELIAYVDKLPPVDPAQITSQTELDVYGFYYPHETLALCHILARRLVRANRAPEALKYFPPEQREPLQRYIAAKTKAENTKTPRLERARAYFDAACIIKTQPELTYPEIEGPNSIATQRMTGRYILYSYDDGVTKQKPKPIVIPSTSAERERIANSRYKPDRRRYHRFLAAELAGKAAALLPNDSEELADVLNCAGNWIRGDDKGDDKAADKYLQLLERRAPNTIIGKEAQKLHWFVRQQGPWSLENGIEPGPG